MVQVQREMITLDSIGVRRKRSPANQSLQSKTMQAELELPIFSVVAFALSATHFAVRCLLHFVDAVQSGLRHIPWCGSDMEHHLIDFTAAPLKSFAQPVTHFERKGKLGALELLGGSVY